MRFWRKKSEGFEWRKYVQTTILMRREQRKAQVRGAVAGAAEGIKAAGNAAAVRADRGLKVSGSLARDWLGASWERLLAAGSIAGSLSRRGLEMAAVGLRPVLDFCGRPVVSDRLVAAAILVLMLGVARLMQLGGERWTSLAFLSAAVLLVLAWVPRVAIGDKPRLIAPVFALPRRAQNSVAAVAATGLAALVIWPALPASTARISLPSLPFAGSPPIEGKAQVLAGGTLRVGGQLVRLAGIEAPERDQKCALTGGRTWSCGRGAEVELSRLARGKAVKCDVKGKDEAGATLAACDAGGVDLGAALVRGGHVFAVEGMFAPYTADEADAKARKVGLWKGNPERPAVARAKAWDAAKAKAPDGCPIKGHVVSGARVYVLPWDPEYGRRSVQKSRGERWFCSEEEAQGAGWKLVGKG